MVGSADFVKAPSVPGHKMRRALPTRSQRWSTFRPFTLLSYHCLESIGIRKWHLGLGSVSIVFLDRISFPFLLDFFEPLHRIVTWRIVHLRTLAVVKSALCDSQSRNIAPTLRDDAFCPAPCGHWPSSRRTLWPFGGPLSAYCLTMYWDVLCRMYCVSDLRWSKHQQTGKGGGHTTTNISAFSVTLAHMANPT